MTERAGSRVPRYTGNGSRDIAINPAVSTVIHGIECHEAWRDERSCPHEEATVG